MPNIRTLYGIIVLLVAVLIMTSSVAVLYYSEYSQEVKSNQNFILELENANLKYNETVTQYNSLASRFDSQAEKYNGSVSSFNQLVSTYDASVSEFNQMNSEFLGLSNQYNETLSLLASSVAVLNTTDPAYTKSSRLLSSLWENYTSIVSVYQLDLRKYSAILASFQAEVQKFDSSNNVSSSQLLVPTKPVNVSLLTANFLIDYGNGTRIWYNDTQIQPGWNFYVATLVITHGNMNATWYGSPYNEHFVNGINGVESTSAEFWFAWSFGNSTWQFSNSGSDLMQVFNGSVYAWGFCQENTSTYLPTCSTP